MNLRSLVSAVAVAAVVVGCESSRYGTLRDRGDRPTFVLGDCVNTITVRGDVYWPGTHRTPCGLSVYQLLNAVGVKPTPRGDSISAGAEVVVHRPGGDQVLHYGANHKDSDILLANGDVLEVRPAK